MLLGKERGGDLRSMDEAKAIFFFGLASSFRQAC
jgi:hypothetical protein